MRNRQLPADINVEKSVLSSLLLYPECFGQITRILDADDFYNSKNQHLFNTIKELRNKKIDINRDAVRTFDRVPLENEYLDDVENSFMSRGKNLITLCERVKELSRLRRIITETYKASMSAYEGDGEQSSMMIKNDLIRSLGDVSVIGEIKSFADVAGQFVSEMEDAYNNKNIGTKTGYSIDQVLNPARGGDYIVLAGRPGTGKTTLAMNVATNIAAQGDPVLILELEMANVRLFSRIASAHSSINVTKFINGMDTFSKEDISRLSESVSIISEYPIYMIESRGLSAEKLEMSIASYIEEYQIRYFIIDYIQLLRRDQRSENKNVEVGEISKMIKRIAVDNNIPVLALSQMSRDVEKKGRRPVLSDLRDSGALEQDADVVIFLHPGDTEGIVEVIIEKQRNGATGIVTMRFEKELTRYVDIKEPEPEYRDYGNQ